MTINEILRDKGRDVITIEPERTVLEAMRLLVHHNIGSLVVVSDGQIHGIITERDGLRLAANDPALLAIKRVAEVMTATLITAVATDALHHVMDLMTRHRVRHVPIMEEHRLAGILSIGDLVNACRASAEAENDQLREYIRGTIA
jgi:CBS domain-containing protein